MNSQLLNQALFAQACDKAKVLSKLHGCVQHVNASLEIENGAPVIADYRVSDWSDGTTMCSYVNGEQT